MAKDLQVLSLQLTNPSAGRRYEPSRTFDPLKEHLAMLRTVLDSVSSGHVLHTLGISLPRNQYHTDRAELLSSLLTVLSDAGLRRFMPHRKLRQLAFSFCDNDPKYDDLWWRQQILRRLLVGPDCDISVKIHFEPLGMSSSIVSSSIT